MTMRATWCVVLVAALVGAAGCQEENKTSQPAPNVKKPDDGPVKKPTVQLKAPPPVPATPLGLPDLEIPADAMTPEKVGLGKQLFFDKRLSKDGSASCETCHVHEKGWTDGLALSTKVGGAV